MAYCPQHVVEPGQWVWASLTAHLVNFVRAQIVDPGPLEREGNLLALAPPNDRPCPPELKSKVHIPGLGLRDVPAYWIKPMHPLEILAGEG